jgi:hypothetical protein
MSHQFRGALDGNTALDANSLAQFTAHAFFLVDHRDLEEFRMIGAGLHGNTIERTDIHAELAGRASDRVHFGFGDGQGLDLFDRLPAGVHNGFDRAMDAANAAIDAEFGIDVEDGFFFARNGFSGAFDRAEGAADAVVEDHVGHGKSFYVHDEAGANHELFAALGLLIFFPKKIDALANGRVIPTNEPGYCTQKALKMKRPI